MNAQETSIRHNALGWVKKSIDDNLSEINTDLKIYIEAEDEKLLIAVRERLGVVQGVLVMIEQYGAAMLTEEMVALVDFIVEKKQEQGEAALEVMLRAVLQLPDYLEHIQSGHKDIPIAILPLLNDIRSVRDQDLFSEKLLFLPDLSMHQDVAEAENIDAQQNQASKLMVKKLRPAFQLALLKIIKDKSVEENLVRLEKVCAILEERSFSEQIARIWWVVGALLESVSRQQLELGASIKNLLGKVDALFRVILIIGEAGLIKRQPIELIKNFLFYIAQPECDGPKAQAIKTAYRLEQFLPSESKRSEVLDNIAGPNQALLKTVAEAMKTDIEAVKSTLEVYVNGDLSKVNTLNNLPQELHVISDTLAMIGLGPQRQLIEAHIDVVKEIVEGGKSANEEQLLMMAAELLQVERALDQMQKKSGHSDGQDSAESDMSRDFERDNVLSAVVTAALDDIQKTKNAILDFIKDSSRSENIELCVTLMEESRGALELLNEARAVAVVDGLLAYLKGYDIVEFMEASRLDALSQVVVSLEYYLEALGEHHGDASSILESADEQLQKLLSNVRISADDNETPQLVIVDDDDPVTADSTGIGEALEPNLVGDVAEQVSNELDPSAIVAREITLDEDPPSQQSELSGPANTEVAEVESTESVPAVAAADLIKVVPVIEELEVLKSGSDPDILEIYLEEAEEESQNIARLQQDWLLHPEDENALKNIRRAFHTIKGSGRLVGAMKIGEFAWDFEQLLNRVIDRTKPPSKQIIHAVGKAAQALLELVVELKSSEPVTADIAYLRGLARALAEFKAEQLLIEQARQGAVVDGPADHAAELDVSETDAVDVAPSVARAPPPNSPLLEEIEPDTMRVGASAFELPGETVTDDSGAGVGHASQDPAMMAEPSVADTTEDSTAPAIAGESDDGYVRAVDYSKKSTLPAASDKNAAVAADKVAASNSQTDSPADDIDATVQIDIIGDAFVDQTVPIDSFDDDDDVTVRIDGSGEAIVDETVQMDSIDGTRFDPASANQSVQQTSVSATESDADSALEDSIVEEVDASLEDPPGPFVDTTGSQVPGEEALAGETREPEPPEPIDLSFDPELLTIYQQEVEQHLDIVSSDLDHAEKVRELVPSEEFYRALHTIHGASRTADISTIGELAGLMEKPLKSAIAQKMALDHEIISLYRQGQQAIAVMAAELVTNRQLPKIPHNLDVSFRALAEDFEEYTVEIPKEDVGPSGEFVDTLTMMGEARDQEQDDELLAIFIDEANELLEMSDHTLHEWSQQGSEEPGAQDYSAVMELQRYLHTLKGGARMAEIKEISDLSHEMESMFIAVIDGRVEKNDNLLEILKNCFDLLHRQVVAAQDGKALPAADRQIEYLRKMRRGEGGERVDEAVEEAISSALDMDSEDIDIVNENLPTEPLVGREKPVQDVIKVRSDLLDNLVSSAGEVSIYRARMEQQVAGLGVHLGELGQTIARLKGQLRSLEAETDAQIHFSHRADSTKMDEFDPLEMDRYTLIQELSRSLSESVNDLSSLQNMLGEQVKDSETLLLQQSRVNTDLQDGLIKSRMVKFSGLLSRLRRLVRQSSQELGKKAELVITGEENEVDNKVLDRMVAPLEHIIRNALSHGIETPVERVEKGKSESGKISIDISRDGSEVVIRVSDDGAGVNLDKVRSRAIQQGLLDPSHRISEADLVQYILEPGFSTAEHVTQLSGRGVGMDVVDIEIKQLGGTLQIESTPQGTNFIARLPFTLSINQAILVTCCDETYAIPLINIEGITRLEAETLTAYYKQDNPQLDYAGQNFALHKLAGLVGANELTKTGADENKSPVILSRSGDVRVALHVDEILGNREIVVKTLGKQLSQVKGLAGASILADGSVVLILDIGGLIRHGITHTAKILYQPEAITPKTRDTVMVVDDSITMRRVASKLLERHNYKVVTAKDGVDALAQLQDVHPDVMLLDIEMPRMDGFELATHMQNEDSFSQIPIIMITSRTGEKHRDRAFEIGVTNYMGKPYQEDELIENIQSALSAG